MTLISILIPIMLTFNQIQLYKSEKAIIPRMTFTFHSDEIDGPKTGNRNAYNKSKIPKDKQIPAKKETRILFFRNLKPIPKPMPNKPVVNGKTINSLG